MSRISAVFILLLFPLLVSCRRDEPMHSASRTSTVASTSARDTAAPERSDEALRGPREVVEEFGRRLKLVSTTAAADSAAMTIRETYRGLVDPSLLDTWATAPANAPGRAVSSPWPDRIEIERVAESGDDAEVRGTVVEVSSTGVARKTPFDVRLRLTNGSWLITAFDESAARSDNTTTNTGQSAEAAVSVLRDYYSAISAHEYERAYKYWGTSGPPGQTLAQFKAGFRDTASVSITTGEPSPIGAAAGSRYVEVPVKIIAKMNDGSTQNFEGTYTMRRAVVDGATAAERAWHIDHATLRRSR